MNKCYSAFRVMFAVLFLLFSVAGCAETKTPKFSPEADSDFKSSIASDVDLNSGITMDRAQPMTSDRYNMNSVSFAVFNHTDEVITFSDQSFGSVVFGYSTTQMKWEVLRLLYKPDDTPRSLPPKIEKWDSQNNYFILATEFMGSPYDQVRLYITGTGSTTGTNYGAYLDVFIFK